MKRIIYIILMAAMVVSTVGGVSALAAHEGDNLTRGGIYLDNATESIGAAAPADETYAERAVGAEHEPSDSAESPSDAAGDGAADGEVTPEGETGDGAADEEVTPEGETGDGAADEGDATADGEGATDTAPEGEAGSAKNPFAAMFDTVKEYATEIFCSLTFVGSILLAYAYKKGLIPLLQGGISTISGTVSRIKESAERGESKTDELSRIITDRLADAEICLDGVQETLGELKKKLDALQDTEGETAKMKLVMSAQVDMLYSIFMTSSLPQYQKDEVGERVRAMKEALCEDEGK